MIVWRDGELVDGETAVSAADRGFLVGDGLFETLLVKNGKPAFLDAHLARLRRGAAALEFGATPDDRMILDAVRSLSGALASEGRAACRVTLTRAGGTRGLRPSPDARIRAVITLNESPPPAPLTFALARTRRFSAAETNAFKCIGGYAPNMLARLEAARAGADEAIMLNEHGRVACASAANIFVLSGDCIVTPPEDEGAMPGTTRALLLEVAVEIGVEIRVQPFSPEMLFSNPVLLSNSLIGAAPASPLGAVPAKNPVMAALAEAYERKLALELAGCAS